MGRCPNPRWGIMPQTPISAVFYTAAEGLRDEVPCRVWDSVPHFNRRTGFARSRKTGRFKWLCHAGTHLFVPTVTSPGLEAPQELRPGLTKRRSYGKTNQSGA